MLATQKPDGITGRGTSLFAAALIAALALGAGWNAYRYPSGGGYDVRQHREYADLLIHHGKIPGPETRSEYYTPPLFYALAGAASVVGEQVHPGDPHKLGQVLNWLVLVATAAVVWLLARELFPRRPWLQLSALAFFCFLPVVLRVGAMFHPEPLSMLLSAVAVLLAARMLGRGDLRWQLALATGVALGLGQLVRAFSLWTFAAVVLAFAVARAWRPLAVVVLVTAVVTAPWYVRQTVEYGNPVFDRPTKDEPVWSRRPACFYVCLGLPDVVTQPIRPHFRNEAIPTTYSEIWGDYFGVWRGSRERQSVLGLLPTLLAVAGWLLLLVRSRGSPARLPVAVLPGLGLLGYLYFTVGYPTPDGDVLKASYMLTTAPAWAIAFGYAVDRLPSRLRPVAAVVLGASALAALPFLLY
ncbi:MAG TPA: glycosyltransferase family 39 protein [Gaiellaceae bacterium]|nr:glycosyltransferase family 39 protein [Gaiellaceae bacterium]